MKRRKHSSADSIGASRSSRRQFLQTVSAAAAVVGFPTILPASVFGAQAPSKLITIGAIGVGRISRDHDLPDVMKYEQARVIAVCDLDSKRGSLGKEWVEGRYRDHGIAADGVRTFADYRELLADKGIDAVIISTPDHWHAKPAIEAARAGKHIYLQKPASLTVQEGRLMSNAVRKAGVVFQLGTQQRSWEQFRYACELVRSGRIGKIQTVRIGLPIDPSGEDEPEMPVPQNLNYDMWLGSTPKVFYTEKRVHPQADFSRPGWLRCEQFGAGMITGWGVHHVDIAHWGMGTELTGPIEVRATAEYPIKGLWDVHGKYNIEAKYANGATMLISDELPNGVRFEGTQGWIFVTRGDYAATASDPVAKDKNTKALTASDPKILETPVGENETRLYRSEDQHGNWLDCIRSGKETISPVEVGHRSTAACLVYHIAMRLGRKLAWDPAQERFTNDDEANTRLARPQRKPYEIEES